MANLTNPPSPSPAANAPECRDVRCLCRNLLAREKGGFLELKCRRCKRMLRVRLDRNWTVIAGD